MILTSLTLTDFAVFRGCQTISLAPRSEKPIVLFGGKNGAGKSTLLDAIRLCLYGPMALGPRISKENYLNYLDSRIHSNPNCLIQPRFASLVLDFQYADAQAVHTYKVTRAWERRSPHNLVERLEIERNGKPLEEIESEHWQDFVRDLIPTGVSQLFFFDGEKIQQLAEDISDQQTLADSIKSLLGLDVVDRLETDLRLYVSRGAKTNGNEKSSEDIEWINEEISQLRQHVETLQEARRQCEKQLSELRMLIAKVESKLASEGGSFARNRESLLQQGANLKARIAQHEESLRQMSGGLLPFALIPKQCLQLKKQLLIEKEAFQRQIGRDLLLSAKQEILNHINTAGFWADLPMLSGRAKKEIEKRITNAVNKPLSLEREERDEVIHKLAPSSQGQILLWIDQVVKEIPKQVHSLAIELENLSRDLHSVEGALRKVPPDEVLKPLLEELHRLHGRLAEISKQALLKDDEVRAAELKISHLERQYNQAADKLSELATQGTKMQLAYKAQKVLTEYKDELLRRKVAQLEQAVSDCFNVLCRKKDALRRIAVDPRDFSVSLYDKRNERVPKSQLSAGEKQVYAIAMLWALAKTSGRPLPIIIDTPLARLDSDHRRLLIKNYFPAASHQVIILSTDTEVDQSYFTELRKDLALTYRLEFEPEEFCTKVKAGYFWKNGDETH